ncbi:MAG: hypothetical protein U5O39_12560 [Gammaproteobacteria bacterium]|nr:hypothetical protein [Gammaproteobacteria bacterium]
MMSLGYPATASLGPTWVTTVVKVPIAEMGFIVMFWGIGSLVGALAMAYLASFERRGLLIGLGTLLFASSFVIFASWHTTTNVIIGNLGIGAGMTMPVAILAQWLTLPVLFPALAWATLAIVILVLAVQRQVMKARVVQ